MIRDPSIIFTLLIKFIKLSLIKQSFRICADDLPWIPVVPHPATCYHHNQHAIWRCKWTSFIPNFVNLCTIYIIRYFIKCPVIQVCQQVFIDARLSNSFNADKYNLSFVNRGDTGFWQWIINDSSAWVIDVKKNYLVISTDLPGSPPKSVPLLLFVPFLKSVLFASAISVDSVDKPPKSVLWPGSLLDVFRAFLFPTRPSIRADYKLAITYCLYWSHNIILMKMSGFRLTSYVVQYSIKPLQSSVLER